MHFECEFSHSRIPTFTWSHQCSSDLELPCRFMSGLLTVHPVNFVGHVRTKYPVEVSCLCVSPCCNPHSWLRIITSSYWLTYVRGSLCLQLSCWLLMMKKSNLSFPSLSLLIVLTSWLPPLSFLHMCVRMCIVCVCVCAFLCMLVLTFDLVMFFLSF